MKKTAKILMMALLGALLLTGCGNRAVEQNPTTTAKGDEVETTAKGENNETTVNDDDVSKPTTGADKETTTPVEETITEKKANVIEGTNIRIDGDTLIILGPETVDGDTFVTEFKEDIVKFIMDNYEPSAGQSIASALAKMREQGKWVPVVKHIKFAEDITKIEDFTLECLNNYKYFGNEELESIEFPKSLMVIEDSFNIFEREMYEGDEIKENTDIPAFVKEESGFYYIGSLLIKAPDVAEVIVPDGITVIGEGAFSECVTSERIVLPEGLISINSDLFDNEPEYSNLKVIEFPKSIEYIADYAFNDVAEVKLVFPKNCNIRYIGEIVNGEREIDWGVEQENGLVMINGILVDGANASGNIVIPDGIVEICREAFSDNVDLTGVTIPESVEIIRARAFYGCTALESIVLSSGVKEIDVAAFGGCSGLKEIEVPNSVTVIGTAIFSDCSSLEKVVLSECITEITVRMFEGCSSLTSIVIPNGVTKIESTAFDECSALAEIKLPESLTYIEDATFSRLESLVSIEIPEGVTSIGQRTFYECAALTEVKLPKSLKDIGESAFSECASLISIEIPEGVTSIGNSAFWDCISLESVEIPESVTDIGSSAFSGCGATIYGKAGSYAESFAAAKNRKFVAQ